MALSDDRLAAIGREHGFGTTITDAGYHCDTLWFDANPLPLMRAIEAEVRGQDEALIRQLVDALNECQGSTQERIDALTESGMDKHKPIYFRSYVQDLQRATDAITAARARLDGRP